MQVAPIVLRSLGSRIRKLREERGVSQQDFADACGVHRTAIGLLERGHRSPRFDTLFIIGRELDVPLTKIVDGIEQWYKRSRTYQRQQKH